MEEDNISAIDPYFGVSFVEFSSACFNADQQAGDQAKVEGKARGILALQPSNIRALAILTFITRAKATAGDKEALLALPAQA